MADRHAGTRPGSRGVIVLWSDSAKPHPPGWYVAYTKPRLEHVAQVNLEQQGFRVYLPRFKTLVRKTGCPAAVTYPPMFPRYVFFQPQRPEQSLATVRSTRGVSTLLRFGNLAAMLDDCALNGIQQAEEIRNTADLTPTGRFKPGSQVRFAQGPLQGLEALVQTTANKRITLLLDILGRPTTVIAEEDSLEQL